jgi:PAS domain S-box-containing protein
MVSLPSRRVLGASLLLAFLFWIADALVRTLFLQEGALVGNLLLDIPPPLIALRLLAVGLLILLAFLAPGLVREEGKGRQAKGTAAESEAHFRELADLLPEAVFEADLALNLTYANRRSLELFGYSEKDLERGIHAMDTLSPESQEGAQKNLALRLKGEDPGVKEYTAVRKDGSQFPVLFHASLIVRDNRPAGIRGIIVDLTERVEAEEKIRATSERFRNLVESSPMGMHFYELRESGDLVFSGANPAADKMLGVDHGQFFGKTLEEAFPPLRDTEVPFRYREAAARGTTWRHDHLFYDDGEISGAFNLVAFQTSPGRMVVLFSDVTEQRFSQERLERSEERLRLATRSGRIGVWDYLPATDHLEWNDLMYELYGVRRQTEQPGIRLWLDRIHPEDLERAEAEFRAAVESDDTPFDTEFRIIRENDGELRHIRGMAGIIREAHGAPLRAIGANWDITEARNAREALRSSEEKFRSVTEQSNDAIYILFQNRFDLVNQRFLDLTGVTREELADPSFDFWELVAEESRPLIRERQEKRERGEPVPHLYEFTLRNKRGKKVQVEASVREMAYEGGRAVLGQLRDISEQKGLQAQLLQSQKMESIGRLSGGVAHDLNNLLTPIIGYAELIRDELRPDDKHREPMEEIVRAGFRAKDLVSQLLAFSRQQTLEFKLFDLNGLIGDFEKLLRRTIREDIDVRIKAAPSLPPIQGDRGQLEQVIMNLAVNAQDAMPEGGTLFIETKQVEFDEAFAQSRPGVVPGSYVMLSLTDTGVGISKEVQAHIFEPFFTTKGHGQGTGLGLATVYGIVKQHGGNIWVYSEPGSGTTFHCYFPLAETRERGEGLSPPSVSAAGGSETIMVVEDEVLVRSLAVTILKRGGYRVLAAGDAEECLAELEAEPTPIDLLLTDVVLPGMDGRQLYQEVVKRQQACRVLFMSGYSDEVVTHRGVLEEGIAFLQKPFSVNALGMKVREVLDEV